MKVQNHPAQQCRPVPSEYGRVPKGDIVKTGENTYQTNRYRIEVTNGEVKVYDLKTNTWIKAWGDPHLHTSDGDKMQFHKGNVTIDLADGTKLTLKPTAPNAEGISLVDGVQIMTKGGGAMVENISGPGGPKGRMVDNSAGLDRMWADGTVLEARGELDDLHFKCGKEIVGTDPSQRWGEHLLDGKGGRSDISFNKPIDKFDISDIRRLLQGALQGRMNPDQLKNLLGRIDQILGGDTWQNPKLPPQARPPQFDKLPGFSEVFPPFSKLRRDAVDELANKTRGTDSFLDSMKGQMNGLNDKINDLKQKIANGEIDKDQLPFAQMELQELLQQRKQLIDMLTSLSKDEHEERMSVIRNLRVS